MDHAYLQTAFEIKTMCDELSRRLLRWHWEQQEGRTLRQLVEYVAQRTEQSPDYFARMQELSSKTTWQQLDTTVCMRVLLDPGDGAGERPLRLLSAAPRPVIARQCCNGLRLARNAAAHATSPQAAGEAASSFAEAVEKLEDGYETAVLTAAELEKYRKAAMRAVNACREAAINDPEQGEPPAAKRCGAQSSAASAGEHSKKTAAASAKNGSGNASKSRSSSASSRNAAASSAARKGSAAKKSTTHKSRTGSRKKSSSSRRSKKLGGIEWLFLILGAVVFAAALWLRGRSMGLFG